MGAVSAMVVLGGCGETGKTTDLPTTGGTGSGSQEAQPSTQDGGPTTETWPGGAADAGNGDAVRVGTWKGEPTAVKVTCSGGEGTVTAVVEAPGGFKATTTQPGSAGGDASVKIEGPGGSVEVQPQGDASVRWGVAPTFTTGFPMEGKAPDGGEEEWAFYARAVSCQ